MLDMKPLEVTDFSGGITENYLQADPRRYEKADNFLIGIARDLYERYGLIPFSTSGGEKIPGGRRVNVMMSIQNDTELVMGSGRALYTQNHYLQTWEPLSGVAGNYPLSNGDEYAQVSWVEFKNQAYLTSDAITKPAKIYRNESNAWTAVTAGLPRASVPSNYTRASLLAKCIAVANDIRTSMINHFQDAVRSTYDATLAETFINRPQLHYNQDRWSLAYLQATSFAPGEPTPTPLPTPAPAAFDETSLFTLVGAMGSAFYHHITDARTIFPSAGAFGSLYHYNFNFEFTIQTANGGQPFKGPFPTLNDGTVSDDLETAAAQLDDLYQKWNWHRLSLLSHGGVQEYTKINKYPLTQTKIEFKGFDYIAPTVTPDLTDVINYVNNLKYLYNSHIYGEESSSHVTHKMPNNVYNSFSFDLTCGLPDAADLDDAYLMIFWLRALYAMHNIDSDKKDFVPLQFTATFGSASITSVIRTDTGANFTLPFGSFIFTDNNSFVPYGTQGNSVARVVASGSGTASLDRAFSGFSGSITGQSTYSSYHSAFNTVGNGFIVSTSSLAKTTSFLANSYETLGSDLDSWLTLASDFFTAFTSHANHSQIHRGALTPSEQAYNYFLGFVPYPNFYVPTVVQTSYAFFFSHEYKVGAGGEEFLVQGNPYYSPAAYAPISYAEGYVYPNQTYVQSGANFFKPSNYPFINLATRGVELTNLPVLVNDASTNYDLANVKLNIYRTLDGGTTYYKVAEVPNGTTTYEDNVNDTLEVAGEEALETRQKIYTTGGLLGYDQPPEAKYIHHLDGFTYYGAYVDTGQYFPGRILQSAANNPDGTPAANYLDLDDELRGISSTRSVLIALCKSSIFRVTGGFSSNGQGSLVGDRIADSKGCINTKSIVQTEIGVFFAGTDGFYYTDGYQIIKISIDMNLTYAGLTRGDSQQRLIYGAYDPVGRRVWWAMKESESSLENSCVYVFHVDYGTKPSGAFTLLNGFNFQPASMVFQRDQLYMGHGTGAILKADADTKYDVYVDVSLPVAQWGMSYIPYWYRSAAVDVGTAFARKWISKIHVIGQNYGNIAMVPGVLRDLNQTRAGVKAMAPIAYNHNNLWGNPSRVWGTATNKWDYTGKMDAWRRLPASTLRSDFVQIEFKPSFEVVYSTSQNYPEFTGMNANPATGVCSLVMPTGYTLLKWPLDCVGMELRQAADGYATSFPILSIAGDQSTVTVGGTIASLVATASGQPFEIWGYRKNQRVNLVSYILHYAFIGDKNQSYPGAKTSSGEGSGGQN